MQQHKDWGERQVDIHRVLQEKFGYEQFRNGQENIIRDVLVKKDVLALLPTGTGKSLCYQLPAYLLDGLTIVISPLLSLMEDQVEQLKKLGEKRVVAYNSFLNEMERKRVLSRLSAYKILYISPESIQAYDVIEALKRIKVSLFVVDEAHCISQWGHEFRTDYMKLATIRNTLGSPPCLALTATATAQVKEDIIQYLALENVCIHKFSMDRPNISLNVKKVEKHEDKNIEVLNCVKGWEGPGIIYTTSRQAAKALAQYLQLNGIAKAGYYHGGMEMEERLLIQRQFLQDQLSVICCTNAFGMGVNKSNVRYVIHYHVPSDLGSYLQEIGRAGRDQRGSIAQLLYAPRDEEIQFALIEQEFPSYEEVERFIKLIDEQGLTTSREYYTVGNALAINETALRFLIFQVENKKMLHKHELVNEIWDIVEKRKRYKWTRLHEMLQYVNSVSCRRRTILNEFDEELTAGVPNCCDLCGIDETDYSKRTNGEDATSVPNWADELKIIFGQV